jgi:hypothetical protein
MRLVTGMKGSPCLLPWLSTPKNAAASHIPADAGDGLQASAPMLARRPPGVPGQGSGQGRLRPGPRRRRPILEAHRGVPNRPRLCCADRERSLEVRIDLDCDFSSWGSGRISPDASGNPPEHGQQRADSKNNEQSGHGDPQWSCRDQATTNAPPQGGSLRQG